jgi:excinuclease ABC subunit C
LVENIDDVDFVITKNENESLILEANLIKQYQPKYNILLKENNNYPYIVLTNEEHPRFIYTRNIKFFKGKVYGPFAYGNFDKYEIYILLNQIFPLRKCYKLPHRKCLYYDIKECVGPCINTIQPEYYVEIAKKVDDFFHGKNKELIDKLKAKEKASAEQLNFESAGKYASLITSIKNITTSIKSDVMLKNKNQLDFVGFYIKESHIAIVIYSYINGKLLAMNQEINTIYDDTNERITDYIYQYYIAAHSASSTVYMELPETDIDLLNNSIEKSFISPKSGKYKSILKTACVNAQKYYESNYLIYESKSRETDDAMDNLKKLIKIEQLNLIHVYDMSNLFEENKIGAMIVVENGKFNKKLYRKFNIKNSESHGDTEYMYECVLREYKKVIEENSGFPDLIIVDGGINQINAAINALQTLELDKIIRVIGLSKNNKHKTSQIVTKEETFSLDIRSPLYK